MGPSVSMPSAPGNREYMNDPSKYQSFDTSGLSQAAIAQGNQAGGNQIAQAKAQAAGMGGGRGSSVQNSVNSIQSGLGQNSQNIFNQNALTGFNQRLNQMNSQNQFNIGEQGLQNQAYATGVNGANTGYSNQMAGIKSGLDSATLLRALLATV